MAWVQIWFGVGWCLCIWFEVLVGFSFGLRFVLWVAYLGRVLYWWVGAAGFGFPGGSLFGCCGLTFGFVWF